jgi:hypothetical protein
MEALTSTMATFPEGAVLVKELVLSQKENTRKAHSIRPLAEDISRVNLMDFVMKDSKRFAITSKWGFFTFGHQAPPYSPSAKVMPSARCACCHIAGVAKTDMVWVQYYPLLRAKLQ